MSMILAGTHRFSLFVLLRTRSYHLRSTIDALSNNDRIPEQDPYMKTAFHHRVGHLQLKLNKLTETTISLMNMNLAGTTDDTLTGTMFNTIQIFAVPRKIKNTEWI